MADKENSRWSYDPHVPYAHNVNPVALHGYHNHSSTPPAGFYGGFSVPQMTLHGHRPPEPSYHAGFLRRGLSPLEPASQLPQFHLQPNQQRPVTTFQHFHSQHVSPNMASPIYHNLQHTSPHIQIEQVSRYQPIIQQPQAPSLVTGWVDETQNLMKQAPLQSQATPRRQVLSQSQDISRQAPAQSQVPLPQALITTQIPQPPAQLQVMATSQERVQPQVGLAPREPAKSQATTRQLEGGSCPREDNAEGAQATSKQADANEGRAQNDGATENSDHVDQQHENQADGDQQDTGEREGNDESSEGSQSDAGNEAQAAIPSSEGFSTWSSRNPTKAVQPSRKRPYRQKTDAEKSTGKMKARENRDQLAALQTAVDEVKHYCEQQAEQIAQRFNKKPEYIHRLISSATTFKQTRAPNLRNALVHKKAMEINSGVQEGERLLLKDVQKLVTEETGNTTLTQEQKDEVLKTLEEHRDLKLKGARATNLGAAVDFKQTFSRFCNEMDNLYERTGSSGFIYLTRGHIHDKSIPGWYASGDAGLFIRDVLKMDPWDVLRKFEMWACFKDETPKIKSLLSLRSECTALILEGLRSVTKNKKILMSYDNYERGIVQKYNVKLIGWPDNVKFSSPHNITSAEAVRILHHLLLEKSCRWVAMTPQEVKQYMREFIDKVISNQVVPRRRKVRADKGKKRGKRKGMITEADDEDEQQQESEREDEREGEAPDRRKKRLRHAHKRTEHGEHSTLQANQEEMEEENEEAITRKQKLPTSLVVISDDDIVNDNNEARQLSPDLPENGGD